MKFCVLLDISSRHPSNFYPHIDFCTHFACCFTFLHANGEQKKYYVFFWTLFAGVNPLLSRVKKS